MDLNHIELTAAMVAELYPGSLVSSPGNPEPAEPGMNVQVTTQPVANDNDEPLWRSLGDNQKKVLIIVNYADDLHLPDRSLQFLSGILGACKLTLADVAIVNLHQQDALYKPLTTHFKSRMVLLFDVSPQAFGLPMHFPHYQLQAFADNTFLAAPSLEALEHDKVEKTKLWMSLKRLFNL